MFAEMAGNISKNVSFQNNEFFDPKLEESTLTVLLILYSLTTTLSIIDKYSCCHSIQKWKSVP